MEHMKTSTEINIKIPYLNGWYQKDRIIDFFEYNYALSNIFTGILTSLSTQNHSINVVMVALFV